MPDPSGVLARGRARQREIHLKSTATVHRATGEETSSGGGEESPAYDVAAADVAAKLVGKGSQTVTVGDVAYEQATALMHLPATFRDLADDDVLELTTGEWSGSFYRVVEAVQGDGQTARRIPVEHIDRPHSL